MINNCPNCGKPVRPGAKFCGSCGFTISPSLPAPPGGTPPVQKAPPVQNATPRVEQPSPAEPLPPGTIACPHCGKPVRQQARFCTSCGKAIAPATPPPARIPPPASPPPPIPSGGPSLQPAQPSPRPVQAQRPRLNLRPFLRKYWIWLVILILILGVGIPLGIYALTRGDGGSEAAATFTEMPIALVTDTFTPTAMLTETPTPTLEPTGTPTGTPAPTLTQTVTSPTDLPSPTATQVPPSSTPTQPAPSATSTPAPLVDENFSQLLDQNWAAWGVPIPLVSSEGWLELGSVNAGDAGVSSKALVELKPGTTIQFRARVTDPASSVGIALDWDAGEGVRLPNSPPGSIRVQIAAGQIKLLIPQNPTTCQQTLADAGSRVYEVRIGEGGRVFLFVDAREACSLVDTLPVGVGRISFSGIGWVDDVKVIAP